MIDRRVLWLFRRDRIKGSDHVGERVIVPRGEALQGGRNIGAWKPTLGEGEIIPTVSLPLVSLVCTLFLPFPSPFLSSALSNLEWEGESLPNKRLGVKGRTVVGEIEAGHGVQVVGALEIAEGERARQIRRHSHGIEALHGGQNEDRTHTRKKEEGQGEWNVLRRGKRSRCERIRGKVEPRFLRRTKTGFRIGFNQLNTGLGGLSAVGKP